MNWPRWILFFFIIAFFSYLRQTWFLSINQVIAGNSQFYAATIRFEFLLDLDLRTLVKIKYLSSIFFTVIISGLSVWGFKKIMLSNTAWHLGLLFYGLVILILLILFILQNIISDSETFFELSRTILQFTHSPMPYGFLSLSVFSFETNTNQ